jgi:hypothetical protein
MDAEDRLKWWREVYLRVIATRGNASARESADEAVRDLIKRDEGERAADEEAGS